MNKIGILLPSYNKPLYVAQSIASIINQTYDNWELFIGENSTDSKTIEVVDCFENHPRISLLRDFPSSADKQTGNPVSVCFNMLMRHIEDRDDIAYITLATDDDFYYPHFLEVVVEHLDTGLDVVYVWQKWIWEDKDGIPGTIQNWSRRIPFGPSRVNKPDMTIDGGSIAFRRECLTQIEYPYYPLDKIHHLHPDGIFMNKLAEKFDFYPISRFLQVHRRTPVSYSERAQKERI